jgi:hypothetical protein
VFKGRRRRRIVPSRAGEPAVTSRSTLLARLPNGFIITSALFFGLLTLFHASMVFLVNSPSNAIKSAFHPLMAAYTGPWMWQTWSLFAPDIAGANYHVIVRGRTASHHVTPWYDATEYFLVSMRNDPLTTARPLSEALYHAASFIGEQRKYRAKGLSGVILVRTSAMILRSYSKLAVNEMQIEIDDATISMNQRESKRERVMRLDWMAIPRVTGVNQ